MSDKQTEPTELKIEELVKFPIDAHGKIIYAANGDYLFGVYSVTGRSEEQAAQIAEWVVSSLNASATARADGWIKIDEELPTPDENCSYLVQLLSSGKYTVFELASYYDGDYGEDFYGGRNCDERVAEKGYREIVAWQKIEPFQPTQAKEG